MGLKFVDLFSFRCLIRVGFQFWVVCKLIVGFVICVFSVFVLVCYVQVIWVCVLVENGGKLENLGCMVILRFGVGVVGIVVLGIVFLGDVVFQWFCRFCSEVLQLVLIRMGVMNRVSIRFGGRFRFGMLGMKVSKVLLIVRNIGQGVLVCWVVVVSMMVVMKRMRICLMFCIGVVWCWRCVVLLGMQFVGLVV